MASLRALYLAVALVCIGSMHEVFVKGDTHETTPAQLPTDGIMLTCTATQMIVDIPKSLLVDEMKGEDVRLENELDADDPDCWGKNIDDDDLIRVTTNLTGCGTNLTEGDTLEVYTNRVINNYGSDPTTRMYHIDIPLECSYDRNRRVDSISYELTDYIIDKDLAEAGAYDFSFEIYTDDTFNTPETSYPVSIGLNQALFFAAGVLSLDNTLDLSIQACRATPDSTYENSINFDFITGGCSTDPDGDTSLTEIAQNRVGVQTNTFRFIGHGDFVYIHCDLVVCDSKTVDSVCDAECGPLARRRRDVDVSGALSTKRFTRGPIRIIREAEKQAGISRIDLDEANTSHQEAASVFNPWMIAMAVMATVVMALAAVMVIVLRKVNKISASPKQKYLNEESIGIMNDNEM